MVNEIAKVISSFFHFLIYERDPDKQAKRAANREYKILKKAIALAVKIRYTQRLYDNLPPKNINQKRTLKKRLEAYDRKFIRLLALE